MSDDRKEIEAIQKHKCEAAIGLETWATCAKPAVAFVSYVQKWDDGDILWNLHLCRDHMRQFPILPEMARA